MTNSFRVKDIAKVYGENVHEIVHNDNNSNKSQTDKRCPPKCNFPSRYVTDMHFSSHTFIWRNQLTILSLSLSLSLSLKGIYFPPLPLYLPKPSSFFYLLISPSLSLFLFSSPCYPLSIFALDLPTVRRAYKRARTGSFREEVVYQVAPRISHRRQQV